MLVSLCRKYCSLLLKRRAEYPADQEVCFFLRVVGVNYILRHFASGNPIRVSSHL